MEYSRAILFCCFLAVAYGQDCLDLTGVWRDDLGSNMTIQMTPNSNKFTGKFDTAVHTSDTAEVGIVPMNGLRFAVPGGSVVAFNTIFDNGQNLISWAGQCMVCGGEPIFQTTYVQRFLRDPGQEWESTIVAYNIFKRPQDAPQVEQQFGQTNDGKGQNVADEGLVGKWNSASGDNFEITTGHDDGHWDGVYNSKANKGGQAYGLLNGDGNTFATLGFAAQDGSDAIAVFASHIRDLKATNKVAITSWLRHGFNGNCDDPLSNVNVHFSNYTLTQ